MDTKEEHLSKPGTQLHWLVCTVETRGLAKNLGEGMAAVIRDNKGTAPAFQKCHNEKNHHYFR